MPESHMAEVLDALDGDKLAEITEAERELRRRYDKGEFDLALGTALLEDAELHGGSAREFVKSRSEWAFEPRMDRPRTDRAWGGLLRREAKEGHPPALALEFRLWPEVRKAAEGKEA